jgi:SAM-dependent methyltransferase
MKYFTLGHRLPDFLANPLFGNRKKFGLTIQRTDPDWGEWEKFYFTFYQNTQKAGIGKYVNDAGYQIIKSITNDGKTILEIGPGVLPHIRFWNGKPDLYIIADNQQNLLNESEKILKEQNVPVKACLINSNILPFQDNEVDVIFTFFSLEHLYPLDLYLDEMKRVLKNDGVIVGAIPGEGGLAWGLGRFLTSRPFIKKNSSIDPDKIICWEHPNFADHILAKLDEKFINKKRKYWPLWIPSVDINLVVSFIYQKLDE